MTPQDGPVTAPPPAAAALRDLGFTAHGAYRAAADLLRDLGTHVADARRRRLLSQPAAAAQIGVTFSTVRAVEYGWRKPEAARLDAFLTWLADDPHYGTAAAASAATEILGGLGPLLTHTLNRDRVTQTAAAHAIGVSAVYVSMMAAGARRPTIPVAVRVLDWLAAQEQAAQGKGEAA